MAVVTFETAAGTVNTLDVPASMRQYINEQGEGRRFSLESFDIVHETEPNHTAIDLWIGARGAEQVEPFKATVVLGDAAARQLRDALTKELGVA